MSKTKSTRILILAGVFVAAFGIGYFGMSLIDETRRTTYVKPPIGREGDNSTPQDSSSTDALIPRDTNLSSVSSEEKNKQGTNSDTVSSSPNTPPTQKIELHATEPSRSDDGYTFKATCQGVADGESVHYELWSNRKIKSSTDGLFYRVPGIAGGRYKLCLVGTGNKNLAQKAISGFDPLETEQPKDPVEPSKKMLITQSEFQAKMLNPNDNTLKMARRATDKKSPLAHNFTLKVIGMSPSENNRPSDVEGVREKIHFNIWKSATVTELVYNESTGQVVQATITPNY